MNIRSYLLENDLKIVLSNNYINVINYKSIENISSNIITLKCENINLDITGDNLVVQKLLNDEILILGSIKNIEFR